MDMLFFSSPGTYVRFYGPYVYLYNKISKNELLLRETDPFHELFVKTFFDSDEMLSSICCKFDNSQKQNIINDFNCICNLLTEGGFIATCEKEPAVHFSYKSAALVSPPDQSSSTENEELSPIDILQTYFYKHPTLFTLSVDLTRACTERCIHCYIPEYKSSFINTQKLFRVIDEFTEAGGLKIKFTGGECMLHPDFPEIIRYADKKKLVISVLSNLTVCNSDIMESLYESAVGVVQTSLYGMSPEIHDTTA